MSRDRAQLRRMRRALIHRGWALARRTQRPRLLLDGRGDAAAVGASTRGTPGHTGSRGLGAVLLFVKMPCRVSPQGNVEPAQARAVGVDDAKQSLECSPRHASDVPGGVVTSPARAQAPERREVQSE